MTPALNSTERYRSASTLGRIVVALLALNVLASLFGIVSDFMQASFASQGVTFDNVGEDGAPFDLRMIAILLIALFELFVFIPTVIFFCVWMYRAHKNLVALGNARQHLEHSSGWAVGSFFVPFVNLVVPYTAMREIWAKSDPVVTEETPFLRFAGGAPAVLKMWWGFWIVSNVINNLALRLSWRGEGAETEMAVAWLGLFASVLEIPAALFAIAVVRGVVERQERRAPQVGYVANVPPPPPIFSPQTVPSPSDRPAPPRPPQDPQASS